MGQALSPNFQWPSEFKGHMLELMYAREYTQGEKPGIEARAPGFCFVALRKV